MSALLQQSIGNPEWMKANETKIKAIFPAVLTHTDNVNWLQINFRLKLAGIEFRSQEELAKVLTVLTKVGMIEYNGVQVRRGTRQINW